jgi:hypothetical protein
MARKKPDLSAALAAKNVEEQTNAPTGTATPITKKPVEPKASSRDGQANIAGWFPMNVKFALQDLKAKRQRELGRTVTLSELQAEAYNELFKKYGMPEIAPTTD